MQLPEKHKYREAEDQGDQEMVGIGSANLLAGLFQGFPVSTSGSRTAVAEQAGAKSQFTGVVAAVLVLAMLLFIPGLVQNMPQSALAAIIITASISLFDVAELRRLKSVQKTSSSWQSLRSWEWPWWGCCKAS